MANEILLSKSLPVKMYEVNPTVADQYLTKGFHEYVFSEQLKMYPYLEQKKYAQPWQNSDIIKMQVGSEYSPAEMSLIDKKGKVIRSVVMQNIGINIYRPTFFTFEGEISLATVDPGCYFLRITFGVTAPIKVLISGPLSVKAVQKGTIMFTYKHKEYKNGIIYETGIEFQFRAEGNIRYLRTDFDRTTYPTQDRNEHLINSYEWEVYQLNIGNQAGVPPWVEHIVSRIMGHSSVMIEGKYYSGKKEFTIEQKTEDGTWFIGLTMEVVEGLLRDENLFLGVGNPNVGLIIIHKVGESLIFGDIDSDSTNTIAIETIK